MSISKAINDRFYLIRWFIWNTLGVFVAIAAMAEIPEFMYGYIRSRTPVDEI